MKYLILITFILSFTACTTVRPTNISPSDIQALNDEGKLDLVNKTIVVTTKDSRIFEAKVLSITEDSFITNKNEIPFSNIKVLEVKKISAGKNTVLVAIVAIVGAAFIKLGIEELFDNTVDAVSNQ